jgi:hypothetical protein
MRARLAECSLGLESSPEQPRGKHIWGWSPGEAQESNTMGKALKERQSVCWKRTSGARHLSLLQGSVAFLHSRAPLHKR